MSKTSQPKTANTTASPQQYKSPGSGLYRHSVACLLCAFVVMLISTPFIEHFNGGQSFVALTLTAVMLFAVMAVGNSRMALVWAIALVTPAIIAKWANHLWPDMVSPTIFLVSGLLFVTYVTAHLFHFIFRTPHVDTEVLCAAISAYMMIGLFFALAYRLIALLIPDSFVFTATAANNSMQGFTSIYFSFVTLCTVGFGDIVPVSGPARSLAMTEGAIGIFYVATLIARLVSLYSSRQASQEK
jgi:voltage-gated potassium channel